MSFMDSLASNPSSGISGMPNQLKDEDALGIVNRIKDREMQDFKDKSTFMADLSLKQDRMKRLYDTEGDQSNVQNNSQGDKPMNTVMATDPNQMTGYQKGELGIRQQSNNLESQKLAQSAKQGEEAISIKSAQEKLNQQKSDQINEEKNKKLENDMTVAKNKLDLAYQQLADKNITSEGQLALHKTIAENTEAYHKLQMAQQQAKFDKSQSDHEDAMKIMQQKLDQAGHTKQTKTDSSGNSITTTTDKGSTNRIKVKGPNGEYGTIEENDELPSGWTKVGGGE